MTPRVSAVPESLGVPASTVTAVAAPAPTMPRSVPSSPPPETLDHPYQVCPLADGRRLAVETFGASDGVPVFFLHGMPGSRIGPYPRSSWLELQGVRLISYDRPGYGGSDRHKGRTVASAADDVCAIADTLGIGRFAVAGRSGGGPHALAVAARNPDRVTAAGVLVSAAPTEAPDLNWRKGMYEGNLNTYSKLNERKKLRQDLSRTARRTMEDPENFFRDRVNFGLSALDLQVVEDVEIRRQLKSGYTEALNRGIDGWYDDMLALRSRWGFLVEDVTVPALLWHGEDDAFVPVDHVHWLASQIPCSEVRVEQKGHFGAVTVLPRILSWLVDRHLEAIA
jgi:pimeloyl-ACP methyl ester carboxylesterase